MNRTFLYFFVCLLLIGSQISCKKDSAELILNPDDYLIFGTFYGECTGNCVKLFKIQNNKLFEDDTDGLTLEEIPFKDKALETAKFEIAKDLIPSFPNDLLASEKRTYGCPDCADQGGVYIALKEGNLENVWSIDMSDEEQSEAIIEYKNRILEVLQDLE